MSKGLLAQSLRDFSSDAWWAVCDGFVDGGGMASEGALQLRVRECTRLGDLRRAAASYKSKDDQGPFEDVEEEGAFQLTSRILETFSEQEIIELGEGFHDVWVVKGAYLKLHRLPDGGIRFAYNIDGNWTTYDAQLADVREARARADSDRLNMSSAVKAAANYQRPVQTGDERSAKYTNAKQAAFDLYESLLRHGFLDAFPVTVNQDGRVVAGNHRLRFAELARIELLDELESERANGGDQVVVADLERRIASLKRDRILLNAIVVRGDADEIRVTTASEIQIPWAEHERRQLAKRLAIEGVSVSEVADMLSESERTIRYWTAEERTDVKAVQQTETVRLRDAGWSQKRVAQHLGIPVSTIQRWDTHSGKVAEMGPTVSTPKTPVEQAPATDTPEPEPVDAKPERDMRPGAVSERQRKRLNQVKESDGPDRPRWTLEDVADAEVIRQLAGLD